MNESEIIDWVNAHGQCVVFLKVRSVPAKDGLLSAAITFVPYPNRPLKSRRHFFDVEQAEFTQALHLVCAYDQQWKQANNALLATFPEIQPK